MDSQEIRALRGALSREEFASKLGVSVLTVKRWELPEDNNVARRPKGKSLEALKRFAELVRAQPSAPVDDDTGPIRQLLDRLGHESFWTIENELVRLVASSSVKSPAVRALAALGIAQVQLFARLDVRGALTTTLPVLAQVEAGELPRFVAARAHVLAAMIFGAFDGRTFNLGRANAHAAQAEPLLSSDDVDLRVMSAFAIIGGARFVDPRLGANLLVSLGPVLDEASSPFAKSLANFIRVGPLLATGDAEVARRIAAEHDAVYERLGLEARPIPMLAYCVQRMLRGARKPDEILRVVQMVRERMARRQLPMNDPMMTTLAAEVEVLARTGRGAEAITVAEEAMRAARAAGRPSYGFTYPLADVLEREGRPLEPLAEDFEREAPGPVDGLHPVALRARMARRAGDYPRAIELAESIATASRSVQGIYHLRHGAFVELAQTWLLRGDAREAHQVLDRAMALLIDQPSVTHSARFARLRGYAKLIDGDLIAARQRFEAALATFQSIDDVVQTSVSKIALAQLAIAEGATDGQARLDAAMREAATYGRIRPEIALDEAAPTSAETHRYRELSLLERALNVVDRIRARGNDAALSSAEIASFVVDVFPGREPRVDTHDALEIGLAGESNAEELAASRVLSKMIPLVAHVSSSPAAPEPSIEGLLPEFIAVAGSSRRLKGEVARLSRSSATILVRGESGSGKEVVARAIHDLSRRAREPYVVFNCASVPGELFESHLFGHRRGAFTGAVSDSPGVILAANGGTLFLDEIGELPLTMQPKLLRFLENAEVMAVGEQRPRRVDVRVIAATHRDLARHVREGHFREDLFYRLNVVPVQVPPLRDREHDIVALANHFLERLTHMDEEPPQLAPDAIEVLNRYPWPGNVRELRNVMDRAMAYAPIPRMLHAQDLRIEM